MSFVCGGAETPSPVGRQLAALLHCCMGAAEDGPAGCTCWAPVYDQEQQPTLWNLQPGQRTEMCGDCAYRPDSPERQGDDRQACSDPGELDDLARGDIPFWCHVGLRKPVAYRHETLGIVVPADVDAYDPPLVILEVKAWDDGQVVHRMKVPVKADGSAGDRCAGWAARKKQLAAEGGA